MAKGLVLVMIYLETGVDVPCTFIRLTIVNVCGNFVV